MLLCNFAAKFLSEGVLYIFLIQKVKRATEWVHILSFLSFGLFFSRFSAAVKWHSTTIHWNYVGYVILTLWLF